MHSSSSLNNEFKLSNAIVLNETSGLGYSPLKAYENKYVYNLIDKKHLYTANTIDLNRYFTSINRFIKQEQIGTNVDDDNWLYRKFHNYIYIINELKFGHLQNKIHKHGYFK